MFIAAIIAGAFALVRGGGDELSIVLGQSRSAPFLLAGIAATAVGVVLGFRAWRDILTAFGMEVARPMGIRLFLAGFLGKFVPGRVWGALAQAEIGRRAGISPARMAATFLVNFTVVLVTGGLVALLVAPAVLGTATIWLAAPVLLIAAVAARPRLVGSLVALAARLMRRKSPDWTPSGPGLRRALLWQSLAWPISGLHVWMLAMLAGAPAPASLPVALGGFALATIAGVAAVFAPDGVGVREVVLITALSAVLPVTDAAVVAVASRVLCTVGELAAAAPMLIYANRKNGVIRHAPTAQPR